MEEDNSRMKLSQLRQYIDTMIAENGDLDVSVTLPGYMLGSANPHSQPHAWYFNLYVLDMTVEDEQGVSKTERIASIGYVPDAEEEKPRHLSVVPNNS